MRRPPKCSLVASTSRLVQQLNGVAQNFRQLNGITTAYTGPGKTMPWFCPLLLFRWSLADCPQLHRPSNIFNSQRL